VFGAGNDLFRLISHFHGDHVGFSTFVSDYSYPTMISSMGHAFVYGRFEKDCHFLSRLIHSQYPAQSDLSAFAGFLSKESSRSGTIAFRPSH
jgi:hypothetical protein